MLGANTTGPDEFRKIVGNLKDGWSYEIRRVARSERFSATVVRAYGDAPTGGSPWPIEDPSIADGTDPAHPTYATVEEALAAAERYVLILSDLPGYPDPAKMSARGFRPTIW